MKGWPAPYFKRDPGFHDKLARYDHDELAAFLGLDRENAKRWRYAYLYGAGYGTAFFWMDLSERVRSTVSSGPQPEAH